MTMSEQDRKEVAAMIARSVNAAIAVQFAARAPLVPRTTPAGLLEMAAQEPASEIMTAVQIVSIDTTAPMVPTDDDTVDPHPHSRVQLIGVVNGQQVGKIVAFPPNPGLHLEELRRAQGNPELLRGLVVQFWPRTGNRTQDRIFSISVQLA